MSNNETIWCACGDGHAANSYGAGFMAANSGVCENCDAASAGQSALHPIQQCLRDNGDLIAAQATIAQQAQMIEHLRGGPTPGFTAVDMGIAAADGFRSGRASVGLVLGKGFNTLEQAGGKYSIVLSFQSADDAYTAYTEIAMIVRLAGEA